MLEDKNQSRTSLAELGEFGLINHITKHFKVSHKTTRPCLQSHGTLSNSLISNPITNTKIYPIPGVELLL